MNLKKELTLLLKGEAKDDEETLQKYSRDASAFEVRPKVVVFPKDVEDIKKLVTFVTARKKEYPELSISVRAGGTCMSGGSLTESIVVDITKYMNHIGEVDTQKRRVTVEPGAYYRDFEKKVGAEGLLMPSYPASKNICAIGGMVANNAGGEKTLTYGKVEDYVTELKMVLADGNEYTFGPLHEDQLKEKLELDGVEGTLYRNLYELVTKNEKELAQAKPRVAKNSAGYYLWNVYDKEKDIFNPAKLIVGSQGTLGVITEATFKLVKPKRHTNMLVVFLRDLADIPSIVNALLPFEPESLESYDDKTLWLVFKYFPGFVKLMGVKNIIKLGFQFLPEAKITLTKGFPRLVVLAEFTGDDKKNVRERTRNAERTLKSFGVGTHIVHSQEEAKKYWTIRRQAFNLIRNHLENEKSLPFIDDVVVRPEKLPEFFPRLFEILEPYKKHIRFALGGHSGSGNFHIYTVVRKNDPEMQCIIPDVSTKVYELVAELDGSITAEHNDGLIRTPFLSRMYSPHIIELFEQTKDMFDPQNIMNPGKKVRGSWEYALEHIKAE